MVNHIVNSIISTITFVVDIKHIAISQWDVEQKDHMTHYDYLS